MTANHHELPRHSVSVAGVILDDDEQNVLLIQRRDNGHWEPPGGVLELNETIEDGLRREVREETGLDVEVSGLTGVYKNMSRSVVALVYRCHTRDEPAAATPEAVAIRWQPLTAIDHLMTPANAVRIHDASNHTEVQTRAHDGTALIHPDSEKATRANQPTSRV